jgi:hypothetical protein
MTRICKSAKQRTLGKESTKCLDNLKRGYLIKYNNLTGRDMSGISSLLLQEKYGVKHLGYLHLRDKIEEMRVIYSQVKDNRQGSSTIHLNKLSLRFGRVLLLPRITSNNQLSNKGSGVVREKKHAM